MVIGTNEMLEFLSIVGDKGFLNEHTVNSRLTACRKFFDILDEDQKTVEYVRDHLDVIKARFSNLNKDVAGTTVEEYGRRVKLVLDDFTAWKADRAGWEKAVSQKQAARPAGDTEKKAKSKTEKPKVEPVSPGASFASDPSMRTVEIPLRKGVEAKLTIPREDFTMADAMKIAWAMVAYASDFDPEVSPRNPFPMLGQGSDLRDAQ